MPLPVKQIHAKLKTFLMVWCGWVGWVGGGVRDETRKGIMRAKEETFCEEREGNRLHPIRGQRGRLSGARKGTS